MAHVRAQAGTIGPRPAGSKGYEEAVAYVRAAFRRFGYQAAARPFTLPQGGTSWNVVAWWPNPSIPDVVVGGGLDTVDGSPGANDNASGVGVVLELARISAGTEHAGRMRFVAFGAEEVQPGGSHHVGSSAYVASLNDRTRETIEAAISVDMIGKLRPVVVAWMGVGNRGAVAGLLEAASAAGVPATERVTPDWSDNGPFERAGMPAAFLWTGDEPNHHEPTDRVTIVARRALRRAGRILVELIRTKA